MDNKTSVMKFLKKHNMYYYDINIMNACNTFIEEMENGLNNKKSTLKMIPTYISVDNDIDYNNSVVAIDAGGTNFRVAFVSFDHEKKPVIEYLKKYPMPGTNGEITKEEFLKQIVEYISPIIDKSDKIGFCFSYPTEILPNKDGRLIKFNKEVKIKGMDGEKLGEGLINALEKNGYSSNKKIVLVNDTVATLLGGKAKTNNRTFDSYIGFILGTGTNTCYIEENKKIKKNKYLYNQCGSSIINIESGGYARMPRSDIDDAFDAITYEPGTQLFEKMVSGGYQGGLMMEVIKQAIKDNLFSQNFSERINRISELSSGEINDFCYFPYGDNILAKIITNEEDRLTLYYIIDAFFERVARLVAINLAAVMLKINKGKNPCKPICISIEGTTFNKSKMLREKLNFYVKSFIKEELGIYCEFVNFENITIIGAAIAGLLG
ncbi:hexokinase family protein [Thermoanaerobacterium thermosaccharolyticum]|jgi:hexokinase|uniref:hexokinase family protein n=1 Tax=Thermoanaerobacterium thermosaccharolyticum TaxID=1517 RepID=UPI003DA8F740